MRQEVSFGKLKLTNNKGASNNATQVGLLPPPAGLAPPPLSGRGPKGRGSPASLFYTARVTFLPH